MPPAKRKPEVEATEVRIGLHSLKPSPGSRKPRKRVGRGMGSGTGKTSGRGHKGYGSRSGAKDRARFEGGQKPIHMRMRKLRGPHMKKSMPFEPFRTHTQPVNLADLEARFDVGDEVTPGDPEGARPRNPQGRAGQDPRQWRADQEADRARARLQRHGPRAHRGGRRHRRARRVLGNREPAVLRTIASAFTVKEIRKKLLFTAAMLALYRLGSHIPVPGINVEAVEDIQDSFGGSSILGFLNLFSGGGLQRLALFALGIMPYVTASIILQLLTVVVPSLEKLQKEGEVGQARITQYTRYLTVALAVAQSVGYVFLFRRFGTNAGQEIIDGFTFAHVFVIVISLTAGTVLLMWLGELITQRGIGNGISLMIFASIASGIPNGINAWWTNPDQVFKVMMPFMALAVIAAVVFVQEGQRRIPVQYAKRVIGRRMSGGGQTYLPLRVNMAGVIPVIFAASIMAFPPTVGQLIDTPWARDVSVFFAPNEWAYIVGESVFIILFTYFYTAVTFNPVDQAENLKKYGGFIPGVRPGRPTAEFLDRILARLTFPGRSTWPRSRPYRR